MLKNHAVIITMKNFKTSMLLKIHSLERFRWIDQRLQRMVLLCVASDVYWTSSDDVIDFIDVTDVVLVVAPLLLWDARRLSQTGSISRPLSLFSIGFRVLIWMVSKTLQEKSLGSLPNTFTFSQAIWDTTRTTSDVNKIYNITGECSVNITSKLSQQIRAIPSPEHASRSSKNIPVYEF